MNDEQKLLNLLREESEYKKYNRLEFFDPYPYQQEFMNDLSDRVGLICSNQTGKSLSAAALDAMDLTGKYPDWYEGYRFKKPISLVCGCVNNDLTRDILQKFLFGDPTQKEESFGSGYVPRDCLDWKKVSLKRGVSDAFLHVMVRHETDGVFDGWSKVTFASYQSGAESWMGTTIDVYHGDEEPSLEILAQMGRGCIATQGRIRLTFTPERGESDVLMKVRREWSIHRATFSDVAGEGCEFVFDDGEVLRLSPVRTLFGKLGHIVSRTLENIRKDNPPWMWKTRMMGLPMIGEGLVFGFMESQISIDPFEFPEHFKFIDALDFGGLSTTAHPTAYVRLAIDEQKDIIYIYGGFRMTGAEIPVIAANINMSPNSGIIPVAYPHDGGKITGMGDSIADQYRAAGVNMYHTHFTNPPQEGKEEGTGGIQIMPGITEMSSRFSTGRLKVFSDCVDFFEEYRKYHMKNGKIVDVHDDFLSACFHPNTEVMTEDGIQLISQLKSRRVLTRGGRFVEYENLGVTRESAECIEVEFDDGHTVVCTPDHLFLVGDEWVKAIDLLGSACTMSCYNMESTTSRGHIRCLKDYLTKRLGSMVVFIQNLVDITEKVGHSSTGIYGSSIMVRFLKSTIFIIKIITVKIMTFQTSNVSKDLSIVLNTKKVTDESLYGHMKDKKNGESRKKVGNSFLRWVKKMLTTCSRQPLQKTAMSVGRYSQQAIAEITDFAQTLASQNGEGNQGLMTLKGSASCVANHSYITNTKKHEHAQESAPPISVTRTVRKIRKAPSSDVYCIRVPDTEAFALSNGVIVHNCRYGVQFIRHAVSLDQKKVIFNQKHSGSSSWMGG